MAPDELKVRARRFPEELLTQGDLAVADELLAPDCLHHAPAPLAPGTDGLKRWTRALRRAFPFGLLRQLGALPTADTE